LIELEVLTEVVIVG